VTQATAPSNATPLSEAQVLGAVNRAAEPQDLIVCAAGGLPGELHKLWPLPGGRHLSRGIRLFLHGL
jgi:3D-(3,5/4)-trihydroxycyclohexane-1,2-dione acylhydrolase (decyclizing)